MEKGKCRIKNVDSQLPRGSIRPVHYVVHFFYRMC